MTTRRFEMGMPFFLLYVGGFFISASFWEVLHLNGVGLFGGVSVF